MMTDYSEASGTLLFDVRNRKWSDMMFNLFSIPRSVFPDAAPSATVTGQVTGEVARLTGIPEGTPVANGSSDNSAAALGAGMTEKGQVTLIIGTAGVISACSDAPLPDDKNRVLCWNYCLEDRWINLGVMQTAGESLNWFKNAFESGSDKSSGDIFSAYDDETADVPDGSDGTNALLGSTRPRCIFRREYQVNQGSLRQIHHGGGLLRPAPQYRNSRIPRNVS